ncbi:MAG: PqiC family protein [Verrucomicrobiia bacterium]
MNSFRSLAAAALCATVTGCFSPHTVATRHFILTPAAATAAATSDLRLGVGVVKMPDYLLSSSLAVRKNAGEIRYLEGALWAERLDKGFARVLAANLSAMIPTDQVLLGAWRTDDVTLEVHVTVEQFDVDQGGAGVLAAQWSITAPGGSKILKTGESRLTRAGKSPASDSQNIAATLSELTATFSQMLAETVREVAPR